LSAVGLSLDGLSGTSAQKLAQLLERCKGALAVLAVLERVSVGPLGALREPLRFVLDDLPRMDSAQLDELVNGAVSVLQTLQSDPVPDVIEGEVVGDD
jgi:hypothetical protein